MLGNASRRILIVDEQEALASILASFLAEMTGVEVAVAHTGEDAVVKAARFAPQCVVLGYNLPDIDGLETASRIRERDPDTRFVLITGLASDAMIATACSQGMRQIVVKPFSLTDLKNCLPI